MRNFLLYSFSLCLFIDPVTAQNIGIGTATPQAKLHVNGDLRLQDGVSINKFSTDSSFADANHSTIPTEQAIKDYLSKGLFLGSYPEVPTIRSSTTSQLDQPSDVCVVGDYAYVTSASNDMLCVFDISNKDAITFVGAATTNLDEPVAVAVHGNIAYVCSYGNGRLCLFDVSNPFMISSRGFLSAPGSRSIKLVPEESLAFVIDNTGVTWYNISDPNNVTIAGFISNGSSVLAMHVVMPYIYLTTALNNQLMIYQGSTLRGFTTVGANPRGLVVRDNYAYVASDIGLSVYDVSNYLNIIFKSSNNIDLTFSKCVVLNGRFAYVLSYGTLVAFDISNPELIMHKGTISGCDPGNVFVENPFIYVAAQLANEFKIYEQGNLFEVGVTNSGINVSPPLWQKVELINNNFNAFTLAAKLGIGNRSPDAPLSFAPGFGKKITFDKGQTYAAGISFVDNQGSKDLRLFSEGQSAQISFGFEHSGGYNERMRVNSTGNVIDVDGGAYCTGSLWTNASDRSLKEHIKLVDQDEILRQISILPISRWNYKTDPVSVTHIGPMAQDFQAIFNTGTDNKTISTIDPSGIALAGIQALQKKIESLEQKIIELEKILANKNSPFIR